MHFGIATKEDSGAMRELAKQSHYESNLWTSSSDETTIKPLTLVTLLALQRGNVGLKVTENTQNHLDFTSQKKRIRNPLEIYSNTLTIIT